jgi:hypothetical protein
MPALDPRLHRVMAGTVERDVVDRAGHPARLHRAVERAGQSVLLMCSTPGRLVVKPLRVLRRQRGGRIAPLQAQQGR